MKSHTLDLRSLRHLSIKRTIPGNKANVATIYTAAIASTLLFTCVVESGEGHPSTISLLTVIWNTVTIHLTRHVSRVLRNHGSPLL